MLLPAFFLFYSVSVLYSTKCSETDVLCCLALLKAWHYCLLLLYVIYMGFMASSWTVEWCQFKKFAPAQMSDSTYGDTRLTFSKWVQKSPVEYSLVQGYLIDLRFNILSYTHHIYCMSWWKTMQKINGQKINKMHSRWTELLVIVWKTPSFVWSLKESTWQWTNRRCKWVGSKSVPETERYL